MITRLILKRRIYLLQVGGGAGGCQHTDNFENQANHEKLGLQGKHPTDQAQGVATLT